MFVVYDIVKLDKKAQAGTFRYHQAPPRPVLAYMRRGLAHATQRSPSSIASSAVCRARAPQIDGSAVHPYAEDGVEPGVATAPMSSWPCWPGRDYGWLTPPGSPSPPRSPTPSARSPPRRGRPPMTAAARSGPVPGSPRSPACSTWPPGQPGWRLIVRKERPHPGAQLRFHRHRRAPVQLLCHQH